jgi:hypothetical protein
MSRLRAQAIAISAFCLCCWLTSAHSDGQLARTIIGDFTANGASIADIADRLAQDRIPVGVEVVKGPDGPPIEINLKNATVAEVLDAAIHVDPRYEWREAQGVINLLPRVNPDPVFQAPVSHFEAANETAGEMIYQLINTPETRKYLDSQNVQAGTWFTGSASAPQSRGYLSVTNVTLRQVLNEILIKTRSVYWCGFYYGERNGKRSLWFQVW